MDADAIVMANGEMCGVLNQHFADSTESLQVVELKRLADHSWRETARGFVVHATWPQLDQTLGHAHNKGHILYHDIFTDIS